jgi:hypothetical protein
MAQVQGASATVSVCLDRSETGTLEGWNFSMTRQAKRRSWEVASVAPVIAALWFAGTIPASAGGFFKDLGNVIAKPVQDAGHVIEKAAHDAGHAVEKATDDTGHATEKAAHDTGDAVEKATDDTGHTLEKAAHDVGNTAEKATHDTGKTVEKAVHDGGDTVVALVDFTGHTWDSTRIAVGDAAKRVQEGKIVDAIWHLSTDPLKSGEANTFKMVEQSNVIRVAGQIAASVYGGPGGAAAFAAWVTYRETGSLDAALKAGVITGVTSAAMSGIVELPHDATSQMVKQAVLSGTVSGIAVAASGGDENAIKEAFFKGAAFSVVRNVYEAQTKTDLDEHSSHGPAYCMAAVDTTVGCAPPREAYDHIDGFGKADVGSDDLPKVDVRLTLKFRPHVGTWAKAGDSPWIGTNEQSAVMIGISKYPGMNAMAFLHDHVSYAMHLDPVTNVVSIVPATVFTYYGTLAPVQDKIRSTVEKQVTEEKTSQPQALSD